MNLTRLHSNLKAVLGEDRSILFLQSLPEIQRKTFILLVIKLLLVFYSGLLIMAAIFEYLAVTKNIDTSVENPFFATLALLVLLPVNIVLIKGLYTRFDEFKIQIIFLPFKTVFRHLVVISLLIWVIGYLFTVVGMVVQPELLHETVKLFTQPSTNFSVNDLYLLFIVPLFYVGIGFTEELIFRAGLYRLLRKKASRIHALIIHALVFSLIHQPLSFSKTTFIFILGFIYAYYFEYKNNLLVPILAHTFQNSIGVVFIIISSAYTSQFLLNITR